MTLRNLLESSQVIRDRRTQFPVPVTTDLIPWSHSHCPIPTVASGVVQQVDDSTGALRRDQTNTVYATLPSVHDRGISVLNHCLEL